MENNNSKKPKNNSLASFKRPLAIIVAVALVAGGVIGGTLAWLTSKTTEVKNVFTISDIDITLDETGFNADNPQELTFKMIPGWTIDKNPYVTVSEDSEDAYVFIKVVEENDFDKFIAYEIDKVKWKALEGVDDVYYMVVDSAEERNSTNEGALVENKHKILKGGEYEFGDTTYKWAADQVLVKPEVTKEMMKEISTSDKQPKLSFTAYAVQYWESNDDAFTPAEAWAKINA